MPRRPMQRVKVDHPFELLKRTLAFVFKKYALRCFVVLICIVVATLASVQGTMFTKTLIDSYITPLIGISDPDFTPLLNAIIKVACFYGVGILASFVQQRVMMLISQGTLNDLRIVLFNKMEELPIVYFDTHSHG